MSGVRLESKQLEASLQHASLEKSPHQSLALGDQGWDFMIRYIK